MNPDNTLYQPIIFLRKKVKVGLVKKDFINYTLIVPYVFREASSATKFLGNYIKELIEKGEVPKDVLTKTGELNTDKIKTAVQTVLISELSLQDDDDDLGGIFGV